MHGDEGGEQGVGEAAYVTGAQPHVGEGVRKKGVARGERYTAAVHADDLGWEERKPHVRRQYARYVAQFGGHVIPLVTTAVTVALRMQKSTMVTKTTRLPR